MAFPGGARETGEDALTCALRETREEIGLGEERFELFRLCLHTAFVNDTTLRFEKELLDGAVYNDEFEDQFFIDLIFKEEPLPKPQVEGAPGRREADPDDTWESIVAQMQPRAAPAERPASPHPHEKKKRRRKKKKRKAWVPVEE